MRCKCCNAVVRNVADWDLCPECRGVSQHLRYDDTIPLEEGEVEHVLLLDLDD